MANSRFIRDTGLTVRMTTVMFLLGAAFVALVVVLMYAFPSYAILIGLVGIGVASASGGTPTRSRCGRCAPAR